MTTNEIATYPRRPLMLGYATPEERTEADRLVDARFAAYQADPSHESFLLLTPSDEILFFVDAGRRAELAKRVNA